MRTYFLPLFILFLFFGASLFLTLRQELLFASGNESLVTVGYVDPKVTTEFFISHRATTPRTVTIEYRTPNEELKTETVTLAPQERKIFSPPAPSTTITVRYQAATEEQTLTLYKK
jgi:hypothetical protein